MQINKISDNRFFTSNYYNKYSKKETSYYQNPPIANPQKTTEYFYAVDRKLHSIPNGWNYILHFNPFEKINFANLISLTFKTTDDEHPYLPTQDISIAEHAMDDFNSLISSYGILSKEEKQKLKDKCLGSFEIGELNNLHSRFEQKKENAPNNLSFLKILMSEENEPYFEAMSPRTLTAILSDEYLDFDYYMEAFLKLKEDNVLEYPNNEIRNTIHTYLTGKTLKSIDAVEIYDENIV